jgi:hypothetical protein
MSNIKQVLMAEFMVIVELLLIIAFPSLSTYPTPPWIAKFYIIELFDIVTKLLYCT